MEIIQIGTECLKIKGKNATFIVDPNSSVKTKTEADAIILLKLKFQEKYDLSKISQYRVVISGSGEYEVSGAKITALYLDGKISYCLDIDNMQVLLSTSEALPSLKEPMRDYNLVVLNADQTIDQSIITALAPGVVVLYGEKNEELAKILGSEKRAESKFSIKKEQIPEEMEVVILQ